MNGEVTTAKDGHACQVKLGGVVVASFDEISNDYAYTCQSNFARNLKLALPYHDKAEEAINQAWSELNT